MTTLSAPFAPGAIHWRAQKLTAKKDKALALAYLDARDVMDRLDEAVGPENWQDSYVETIKGRVICTISIRLNGEWIAKSDGAGATDVEGDKGGISDAFKRAAVKWGIGRYLYDLGNVYAPCELYNDKWSAWKPEAHKLFAQALAAVGSGSPPPAEPLITEEQRVELMQLLDHLNVPVAEALAIGKLSDLRDLQAARFVGIKSWINNRAIERRDEKKAA